MSPVRKRSGCVPTSTGRRGKWRESAEQIELYYADRWRDFKPLSAAEKSDIIRAVVGYALAEDTIGLTRFREKYLPLMSGEADRAAFEIASKPVGSSGADFAAIAKMAASVDTLEGFLREMKTRYPDATARANMPPGMPKADPVSTGSLPAIAGSSERKQAQLARARQGSGNLLAEACSSSDMNCRT